MCSLLTSVTFCFDAPALVVKYLVLTDIWLLAISFFSWARALVLAMPYLAK